MFHRYTTKYLGGIFELNKTRTSGFTLVELIVVIAIVAILSAVSIVGFRRFIDNAKWSNDSQLAVQMTNTVRNSLIGEITDDLDAADVRRIIEDNHGGSFDFTPETSEAGFFFLADNQQIVVQTYEYMAGVLLSANDTNVLLSDTILEEAYAFGNSPEEIFGVGKYLLTTEGSAVAELVTTIRNYYRLVIEEGKDETYLADIASRHETLGDLLGAYAAKFSPTQNVLVDSTGNFDLDTFFDNPLVLSEDMTVIFPDEISQEVASVVDALYAYEALRQRFEAILDNPDAPDGQALFGGQTFPSGDWGTTGQSSHQDQIDFFSRQGILPADDPYDGTLYSGRRYDALDDIRDDIEHPLTHL
jgi:prepilin-type N-terminal cleavage/methylation domain-containing protein